MPTPEIDYDQKTQEELTTIAVERGVPDVEIFRKSELRRLLRALDDGDLDQADEVRRGAKDRTKKQSATADSVMERAKANAGKPLASKPSADKALEKPQPSTGGLLVEDAAAAAPVREPLFVREGANDGDSVIARMKARAARNAPPERSFGVVPRRSLALQALEQAQAAGSKPPKVEDVAHFEVLETTRYFARHGTYHLNAGSIVSALTHDMESLRASGAKLRQIDPTKTVITYSELGHPTGMKTQPLEQQQPQKA